MSKLTKTKKIICLLILAGFILPTPYLVYAQEENDENNLGEYTNDDGYVYDDSGSEIDQIPGGSELGSNINRVLLKVGNAAEAVRGTVGGKVDEVLNRGFGISAIYAHVGSIALGISAFLFKQSILLSVVNFSELYNKNKDTIGAAWRIGRDLANFFFIFILLYIAISTILDRVDWKKLLVRVIIIALLVNFSAVIPKVMIDASNILALTFYDNIGKQSSNEPHDLTAPFVKIFDSPDSGGIFAAVLNFLFSGGIFDLENWLDGTLMFILAYILLIGAILFIVRIVVLIMLIILSPLAFIGWIIPSAGEYSNQWWKKLLNESIFAPAFMFLLYATITIIENNKFNETISGLVDGTVSKIIYAFIVITFLTFTLTVAKKFSSTGAGIAIGWADKVKKLAFGGVALGAGAAGAYTLGKGARAALKSETFQKFAARNPFVGNLAQAGLSNVAKKKFGGATSYEERVEKTASRVEDFKTSESRSQYLSNLGEIDRKAAYNKLTDRQKAELHEHAEDEHKKKTTIPVGGTPLSPVQLKAADDARDLINNLGPKVGTEPYEKMEAERKRVKATNAITEAKKVLGDTTSVSKALTAGKPIDIEVRKLGGDRITSIDPSVLLDPAVAIHLDASQLTAIMKDQTFDAIRPTIRRLIEAQHATTKPAKGTPLYKVNEWLNFPGGSGSQF